MPEPLPPTAPPRPTHPRAGGGPTSTTDLRGGPRAQGVARVPAAAAGPAASPAETRDAVTEAVARAVAAWAPERDLAVDTRYDRATGRVVHRVADRGTGEVVFESPPEELLRFFASAREPLGAPLVTLEA